MRTILPYALQACGNHSYISWKYPATFPCCLPLKQPSALEFIHMFEWYSICEPILEQMKNSVSGPSINRIIRMKSKSSGDTSVLVGVYVVFQLAVLGSLLSTHSHSPSQPNSCDGISWVPPHVYLSAVACLSAIVALAFAFITETHLDFIQRRLLLLQNVSGDLMNTGDGDVEGGGPPCSCSFSSKDYFSAYRLAISVNVLVFPVLIFNTSRRLLC